VLTAEDRGRTLGFEGRQRVLERFTFAAQARDYLDLFAELCGARPARASAAAPAAPAPADAAPQEIAAVTSGE
jgi:hypothetical protein